MISNGLPSALISDEIMVRSDINYTTLRLPWLNDRGIKYEITHKNETYLGVSGSCKSMTGVVLQIIAYSSFLSYDSAGIPGPDIHGEDRPVY